MFLKYFMSSIFNITVELINVIKYLIFQLQYYFDDPGGNNKFLTIYELDGKWPFGNANQSLSWNQIRSLETNYKNR